MKNLSPFYDTFYYAISSIWPMLLLFVIIIISIRLAKLVINKEKFVSIKTFILYFLFYTC